MQMHVHTLFEDDLNMSELQDGSAVNGEKYVEGHPVFMGCVAPLQEPDVESYTSSM